MRIVYLHQYFNTPKDASGTRSYEMARRLVKYGHQVEMITSARKDEHLGKNFSEITEVEGIVVHWLPVRYTNQMGYLNRIKAFFSFACKAAFKAASLECDLVFATSTPLTIALPAAYAAWRNKVPMVFEVRDLWPELPIAFGAIKNPILKWAARRLELFAYRRSAQVIALSPGMREGVIRAGYPADKVVVIPNSCDFDLFNLDSCAGSKIRKSHPWLADRPMVLYAGTIGEINGVDYLAPVAAYAYKLNPEICFVVIGSGKGEKKLRSEADRLGVLDRNLYLLPRVPKYDIAEWFAAADITLSLFVNLEPMWANSANKFFDSLAASKPVAINYGGWQADFIRESGAGLVISPVDAEAAARALAEKITDKKWLDEAGQSAGKLGRERFDRDLLAKQLEAVLFKVHGG